MRHRFPSAVLVNVMPVPSLPTVLLPLSSSATAPAFPVLWVDGVFEPDPLWLRRAADTSEVVFSDSPTEGPAADSVAVPPDGAGDCGAAVVGGVEGAFGCWPFRG